MLAGDAQEPSPPGSAPAGERADAEAGVANAATTTDAVMEDAEPTPGAPSPPEGTAAAGAEPPAVVQAGAQDPAPPIVPLQDDAGLPFQATVANDGVIFISGAYTAQGNQEFYGSLVAEQGVLDGGGTPAFYFDESLIKGQWPRPGMDIPRVVVTAWQTDL